MDDLKYKFEELIKTLILLGMPAEKQIEYSGDLIPFGDDIVNDFDVYYTHSKNELLENNFLNHKQVEIIDRLDNFFEKKSGEDFIDFWTDNSILKTDPDWKKIRELAKECLMVLGKNDCGIKIDIENEIEDSKILIRKIKSKIIEKNEANN